MSRARETTLTFIIMYTLVIYSTSRSKAVLVLLLVALWFILRGDLV